MSGIVYLCDTPAQVEAVSRRHKIKAEDKTYFKDVMYGRDGGIYLFNHTRSPHWGWIKNDDEGNKYIRDRDIKIMSLEVDTRNK